MGKREIAGGAEMGLWKDEEEAGDLVMERGAVKVNNEELVFYCGM